MVFLYGKPEYYDDMNQPRVDFRLVSGGLDISYLKENELKTSTRLAVYGN